MSKRSVEITGTSISPQPPNAQSGLGEALSKPRRCANCNHTEGNHQPKLRQGSVGCRTCYCPAFVLREVKA